MDRQSAGPMDFSKADLHITDIETVCYEEHGIWGHSAKSPRRTNGLLFVCSGSIEYRKNKHTIVAHRGDIVKFVRGIPDSFASLSEVSSFYAIDFNTAEPDEFDRFPVPALLCVPDFNETENIFRALLEAWSNRDAGCRLEIREKLYVLLHHLLQLACREHHSLDDRKFLKETLGYIQMHFKESELFIGSIAKAVNVSESQFRRCFQKLMHQTPVDYIRALRIGRAKDMLRYSCLPVTEIAYNCGFSSLYYFSRSFKNETGYTPHEYRNL